ncbi:hypothetical protein VB711_09095 [Cronbergia sp. UHCC 0137]|uniref:hypothetical protein n=1 Tax=Cronbergia sp. UHCC 0137 TaxID=3110239 RepID=UPI002B204826|nr:hypothetical protein [Cronbergia sp. UHCC 0137]MEA5617990.1 hypothetical protein [Cronbergia sp. UHCC 0137]
MTQTNSPQHLLDHDITESAKLLHEGHMHRLGIANTMQLAHSYNKLKFQKQDAYRIDQYQHHLDALLAENGAITTPTIHLNDGWHIDTSMSLPFLDEVLEDSEKIISERAGKGKPAIGTYRSYFQDMWTPEDLVRYPSFLNFVTSSTILSTVSHYIKSIPVLSSTLPSGIRFVESSAEYDDQPEKFKDSQLFHVDYYSLPNVYVLVLLRDTTIENGPWSFLPKSVTVKAVEALNNWQYGVPYRFSDEQVYSVVDKSNLIELCYPRGTVLFIESSGCMHYGSRNAVKPRYKLMIGYSGLCRTDFSEGFMRQKVYPVRPEDSKLRKMLLDKNFIG